MCGNKGNSDLFLAVFWKNVRESGRGCLILAGGNALNDKQLFPCKGWPRDLGPQRGHLAWQGGRELGPGGPSGGISRER